MKEDKGTLFGEACNELHDNPWFEKIVDLENLIKLELTNELLAMDQQQLLAHGSVLSGMIRGINKLQEYRVMHKNIYLNERNQENE